MQCGPCARDEVLLEDMKTCQVNGVRKESMVLPLVAGGMRMPEGSSEYACVKSITLDLSKFMVKSPTAPSTSCKV